MPNSLSWYILSSDKGTCCGVLPAAVTLGLPWQCVGSLNCPQLTLVSCGICHWHILICPSVVPGVNLILQLVVYLLNHHGMPGSAWRHKLKMWWNHICAGREDWGWAHRFLGNHLQDLSFPAGLVPFQGKRVLRWSCLPYQLHFYLNDPHFWELEVEDSNQKGFGIVWGSASLSLLTANGKFLFSMTKMLLKYGHDSWTLPRPCFPPDNVQSKSISSDLPSFVVIHAHR